MAKNENTFQNVSSVLRVVSRNPSSETRRVVHGWPDEKKFHRSASAPWVAVLIHGSMTLPFDFDIFWPSSSTRRPRHTTFLNGVESNTSVFTASSE